ncbi:MAG: NAD(P)H-binding protein [Actinomycetota bacterium]
MPVIVVGADTPLGHGVLAALSSGGGEVRAFVTDPSAGARLRAAGIRVALGDVSDGSHLAGAAVGCYSAVLLAEAAIDGRERSFASDGDEVLAAWAAALGEAGVTRAIWVGTAPPGEPATPEVAVVETGGRSPADIAAAVVEIDDGRSLPR